MKTIFQIFLILTAINSLLSCRAVCSCEKTNGCTELQAISNNNNIIIDSAKYCSEVISYYSDSVRLDSVSSFYSKYYSDTTTIIRNHSITSRIYHDQLRMSEIKKFENAGFECDCDK